MECQNSGPAGAKKNNILGKFIPSSGKSFTKSNSTECHHACLESDTCEAWVYESDKEWCFLKVFLDNKVTETGVISGPKDCKAESIWQGKTIIGHNLIGSYLVDSLEDCKTRCQDVEHNQDGIYCDFYHFVPDSVNGNHRCQLKGITDGKTSRNIIFGARRCPGGADQCKMCTPLNIWSNVNFVNDFQVAKREGINPAPTLWMD